MKKKSPSNRLISDLKYTNMKKIIAFTTLIFALLLTGCQEASGPGPERPLNTGDDSRITKRTIRKASDIVPTLTETTAEGEVEYRLESQTAAFTDNGNAVEIILANNIDSYCQDRFPEMKEGQKRIVITLNSAETGEFGGDKATAVLQTADGETPLTINDTFKVNTLNESLVRGTLSLSTEEATYAGDFFAAMCKEV